MALTDNYSNVSRPALVPVAPGQIPHAAIARLPVLHAEAAEIARLGRFVAHSVQAAGLLILAGAATLAAGGGTLASDFVWSLLVLAGITAMTLNHIRGQAAGSLHRKSIAVAAADLRAILLYTGFAWGAGAFLALPAEPSLALGLAFAVAPTLLMVALLKDEGGIAAFTAPVMVLTAAAALFKDWPEGHIACTVLVAVGLAVILFVHLHNGRARLVREQHGAA